MELVPRLIAWELTGACNLECVHCRASATKTPSSDELSTEEAKHLIDDIASFAKPIIILSGGEPLVRDDVYEIAKYGMDKGLRMVLATNGILVTREVAKRLKDAGIRRVSISIDGASAKMHDEFRGLHGAFDGALRGMKTLKEAGLSLQINTTITKRNLDELPKILDLALELSADALHIFMLVPTGRGEVLAGEEVSPEEYERVLNWLYDAQKKAKIQLKATCAPHYFRIMYQRAKHGARVELKKEGFSAMTKGCLAGTGFCFISRTGEVYPCGYLPVLAGDIRRQSFWEIWRSSKVFIELRDGSRLKGKCARCEFRRVCGGCRARAYAVTGDYLDEEPYCIYQPGGAKRG
ncbi:MAG: heme b synthase [Methanocellales archaeon]|nr:heme b synthase [Methanocellales archaeon]